ncbi:MAG: hypothetical protein ACJAX5_002246 [Patiriisocius sp.]|jgi:hypothetical protein
MKANFYTTSGCHLCELALEIIVKLQATDLPDLEIQPIDIADHDDLVEKYGIRIPVIQALNCSSDLGWPFDEIKLKNYLGSSA